MRRTALLVGVAVVGFNATLFQSALLRALMSVAGDTEFLIGFLLGSWLFWSGVGSLVAGRVATRIPVRTGTFIGGQLAAYLLLPVSVASAALCRTVLGVSPGLEISLVPLGLAALLWVMPFGVLSGVLFACALRLLEGEGTGAGSVYTIDALGSFAGGVVFSYALAGTVPRLAATAVGMGLVAVSVGLLLWRRRDAATPNTKQEMRNMGSEAMPILLLAGAVVVGSLAAPLTNAVFRMAWRPLNPVKQVTSRLGSYTLLQNMGLFSVYQDGIWSYSYPMPLAAEEKVELAFAEFDKPLDILLVNVPNPAYIRYLLRHRVERIVTILPDPAETALQSEFVSESDRKAQGSPRVRIVYADARRWLRRCPCDLFDVIIMAPGPPLTMLSNRYYTVEFFKLLATRMARDGVLLFSLPGGENYLAPARKNLLASVRRSAAAVFKSVVLVPGEEVIVLASPGAHGVTADPVWLRAASMASLARGVTYEQFDPTWFRNRLEPERVEWLNRQIAAVPAARINHDFRPSASFYYLSTWLARVNPGLARTWLALDARGTWLAALVALLFGALALALRWHRAVLTNASVLLVGFCGVELEIFILLGFTCAFGYVYYMVGAVIGAFMLGVVVGSWAARQFAAQTTTGRAMAATMALLGGFSLLLPLILIGFEVDSPVLQSAPVFYLAFPLLAVVAGIPAGAVYPLATGALTGPFADMARAGSVVFATDLLGGMVGALGTSFFMLPILGIHASCVMSAAVCAAVAIAWLVR